MFRKVNIECDGECSETAFVDACYPVDHFLCGQCAHICFKVSIFHGATRTENSIRSLREGMKSPFTSLACLVISLVSDTVCLCHDVCVTGEVAFTRLRSEDFVFCDYLCLSFGTDHDHSTSVGVQSS
jgi:hypothetical protein